MSYSFKITYLHPAEPLTDEVVTAAIITLNGERYEIGVHRHGSRRWMITFGDTADDAYHLTFHGAVTTAHFNAYIYAVDLSETRLGQPPTVCN